MGRRRQYGQVPVNRGQGQRPECVVDYNLPYWNERQPGDASAGRPSEVWEPRWGSIALNAPTGASGSASGERSETSAEALALHRCGEGCVTQITYRNQCAAVATGGSSYSVNSGASVRIASQRALKGCSKYSAACEIAFTECSLPERVK